ncbi:UDP-Glycosyltransferase superfamily protein [Perilla frutescens var. hirtella]|nr:UDP-Glycosyltransferase superfamily protein [Perilla frutescens var. hirtella]KAH6805443.1 UDP-Glycosyltransferase superfamily protein [Perilla frutescens var. frutescens]
MSSSVHILVFPFPAQGHMLPLLDLTHQLSLRGLTITILITPKNLPILTPLLSSSPSIQTLILPFPDHPSLPPGVENVKDIGNHGNIPIMAALTKLQHPIIQWFNSHPNPPVALLSEFFLGWTHHLATHLQIPRIAFYSVGAFTAATFNHLWSNYDSLKPGIDVEFDELPRTPVFPWDHLPSLFRRCKDLECTDKNDADFIKTSMAANALSWASVFNSFWPLEDQFLEFLRLKQGHPRVYSVGPLNLVAGSGQLRAGDSKCDSDDGVISWLDGCEDGSVLYVCFGSQKWLKSAQAEALAIGLETSGVRFVWVIKTLSAQQVADGYGSVPDGFETRVSGRGFVLKGWAPQTAILSHRAVGGFLSHCGWNSVLEAMTAGVMILGWPMEADQFANARLLVEYKGAAALVCEGADTVPDSAELARKLKEAMHGGDAATPRSRAKELCKQASEAVNNGGSSMGDLDRLVQQVSQLKAVKNV